MDGQVPGTHQHQVAETSGLAIASLILAFLFPIVGLPLGIAALVTISKNPAVKGKGLAIAGVILSTLSIIITVIMVILAMTALNSVKSSATDTMKMADVKELQAALELYKADKGGYPMAPQAGLKLGDVGSKGLTSNGFTDDTAKGTVYMGVITAPYGGGTYEYMTLGCAAGPCMSYELNFSLGGMMGDLSAGMHKAIPGSIK